MSGNWLDESEILFRIFFILSHDLKVRVNLGIPCLIFLSVLPLPQIFNILNGWLKSSYPKVPTSFLFSVFLWESSKACGTEQVILPFLNREGEKKRNRQQQIFPGGFVLELGVGSRRGGKRESKTVDAPGGSCGSWYAELRSRGAGVRLVHISPVSLFNYLKSKTSRLGVCETPVSRTAVCCSDILRGQPRLSANVRAGSWQRAISAGPGFLPFRRHCVEEGLVRNLRFLPVLPARTTLWQIGLIFFF